MFRVLVIGAGNIGARHIQSLCQLDDIKIDVLEPAKESLHILKSIIGLKNYFKISFYKKISEIKTLPDMAIVATPANPRKKIILKLLDIGIEKFLLEKLVCQSSNQYNSILKAFSKNDDAQAWVNFPRRYMPIYNQLKKSFKKNDEPIRMLVDAGNLGIACGAIHQIDIFQYLTDASEFKIQKEFLKLKAIETKRKNYIDFAGNLIIETENNSSLTLNFTEDDFWPLLEIYRNSKRYVIIDSDNCFSKTALKSDMWQWKETQIKAEQPLVSKITAKIIKDIINNGDCKMPTLADSLITHKIILDVLLDYYNKNIDNSKNILPIT